MGPITVIVMAAATAQPGIYSGTRLNDCRQSFSLAALERTAPERQKKAPKAKPAARPCITLASV
jgi:hypothetical protein